MPKNDTNRDLSLWVSPDLWDKHKDCFQPGDLVEFHREGKLFQHWGLYLGDGLVVHVSSYDLWNPSGAFTGAITNASQASVTSGGSIGSVVPAAEAAAMELCEISSGVADALSGTPDVCELKAQCGDVIIEPSPLDLGYKLEDRTKWFIKVEHILRIAGRDQFRVNNVSMYNRIARTPQEIFKLVKSFKDTEVDYSLVSCNCEHFVSGLKYKTEGKNGNATPDIVPVVVPSSCGSSSQVRRAVQLISIASLGVLGLLGTAIGTWIFSGQPAEPVENKNGKPEATVKADKKPIETSKKEAPNGQKS